MTDFTIEREIVVDAPATVVWRTLTEPAQIARWFADRVDLELRPGASGSLTFTNDTTSAVTAGIVVEAVDPPHLFSFRWGHPQGEAPSAGNSVLVAFTLTELAATRTRLRVVETGLEATAWSSDEKSRYADDHRQGWAVHLGRLGELYAPSSR